MCVAIILLNTILHSIFISLHRLCHSRYFLDSLLLFFCFICFLFTLFIFSFLSHPLPAPALTLLFTFLGYFSFDFCKFFSSFFMFDMVLDFLSFSYCHIFLSISMCSIVSSFDQQKFQNFPFSSFSFFFCINIKLSV